MKATLLRALLFVSYVGPFFSASSAFAADRAALVIGNNAYLNATPLKTAANDAQAVWEKLRTLGFDSGTAPILNASLETTVEAVEAFKLRALGAHAAIVYYAGHGIEHAGINYLIPVDALLEKAVQLKTQAYSLNALLAEVKTLQVPTRLVILDCCRNNPLPERTWSRGTPTLADINDEALGGATMVVFSAAPGTTAKDRLSADDTHSPFATALLAQLGVPGQGLFNLFGEVEKTVFAATDEAQKPKVRFSGDVSPFASFLMHPGNAGSVNGSANQTLAAQPAAQPPLITSPSPELPSSGYYDLAQVFDGTPYDAYNSYTRARILSKAQEKLKAAGLYQSSTDGAMGPGTERAIIDWQRQQSLPATGRLDHKTQASLTLENIQESTPPATPQPKPTAQSQNNKQTPSSRKMAQPAKIGATQSGFMNSPTGGLIDVRGIGSGRKVRDPYTGQILIVP